MAKPPERHVANINFRRDNWALVRDVAILRGQKTGKRVSVSEAVNAVIEDARAKLERELERG